MPATGARQVDATALGAVYRGPGTVLSDAWQSLAGAPETDNQTSVTVAIPRSQCFDPDALQTLMQRAEKGQLA